MDNEALPNFETSTEVTPAAPKRQRKAPPKKVRKARNGRKSVGAVVRGISSIPKRARKKRTPRKLPKPPAHDVHLDGLNGSPLLAPEAAGVIRAFTALDETQRAMVFNYIQALR